MIFVIFCITIALCCLVEKAEKKGFIDKDL